MTVETLIWIIPLPPVLAFVVIVLLTNRNKAASHTAALLGAFVAWALSMYVFFKAVTVHGLAAHPLGSSVAWIPTAASSLRIGVLVDPLSAIGLFFVAWTVLMIFVYSVGYHNFGQPTGDRDVQGCRHAGRRSSTAAKNTESPPSSPCTRDSSPSSACSRSACTCW